MVDRDRFTPVDRLPRLHIINLNSDLIGSATPSRFAGPPRSNLFSRPGSPHTSSVVKVRLVPSRFRFLFLVCLPCGSRERNAKDGDSRESTCTPGVSGPGSCAGSSIDLARRSGLPLSFAASLSRCWLSAGHFRPRGRHLSPVGRSLWRVSKGTVLKGARGFRPIPNWSAFVGKTCSWRRGQASAGGCGVLPGPVGGRVLTSTGLMAPRDRLQMFR